MVQLAAAIRARAKRCSDDGQVLEVPGQQQLKDNRHELDEELMRRNCADG